MKNITLQNIIKELTSKSVQKNIDGQQHFGIQPKSKQLGVSMVDVRALAKTIKKDALFKKDEQKRHELAQQLWDSNIHEAKILATLVDGPDLVTKQQMEEWVMGLDSWDICDQLCSNLFDKTPFAYSKAQEWSSRNEEFVRRAGFVLMATLSVHDKNAENKDFEKFYPLLTKYATDERNFVKKAVNWAIRQIGKRNTSLNKRMIALSEEILRTHPNSKAARWIANGALRELQSEKIQKKLEK